MNRFRIGHVLPWVVLVVGLGTTYSVWKSGNDAAEQEARAEFEFSANEIFDRIENRLGDYEGVLRGSAGLFAASESVTRSEFREYVASLQLAQRRPGIQGVGFALVVPQQQYASHIAQIRKEGFPDYAIRPEGNRPTITSVVYIEPFSWRNRRAFGYDMYSEPVRREAMTHARDQGRLAVSGKVTLVQETDADVQPGFLMYLPVYRNGVAHDTLSARRQNLVGWAYAPFRLKDLMGGVLGKQYGEMGEVFDLEIFDKSGTSSESLLYDSDAVPRYANAQPSPAFQFARQLDVGGRKWTLAVASLPGFEARYGVGRHDLAVTGVAGTLLLTLVVWLIAHGRARALREAEKMEIRYRKLFEEATGAIALADAETGELLDLNPAMEKLVGWRKEEVLGKPQGMLHPEPGPDGVSGSFARHRSTEDGGVVETQMLTKYGHIREVEVKAGSVEWNGRKALLGFFHDVTDRKRDEKALQEAHGQLEAIFDNIHALIAYLDADFNFLQVNRAYADAAGHPPEFFIGKNHFAFYPNAENEAIFRRVVESGEPYSTYGKPFEYPDHPEWGVSYWDWTLYPIKGENGEVVRLVFSLSDVTERERAEEELQAQRRFMRQVIDTDPNRIFVKDAQGRFLLVNQAMAAAHGLTPEEMVGRVNAELNPNTEEVEHYLAADRDVIESGREQVSVEVSSLGGEPRCFLSIKRPMEHPNGAVNVLGISVDITDRKLAEERLGEAYDKLRLMSGYLETVREEEQRRIARELHDEMGGVLAALNMRVARLESRLPAEWREDIGAMANLVSQGIHAMRHTVSKLRPSLLDDVGFVSAVEHYVHEFQQATGLDCQLINSLHAEELELDGHRPATLFRILQESLTNVAKHAQATKVTVGLKEYRGSLVLVIRDNGKGFDRPAHRTDWFGLLGIKERALMAGGRVRITSQVGRGTTVWVRVPMTSSSAPLPQKQAGGTARG